LKTKLYDKRDDFTFPIVKFPFISSNILASSAYGVYISQLIRFSRDCAQYIDFLDRSQLLTQKLLKQGCAVPMLDSLLQKVYGRHHDLVKQLSNIHISNDNESFQFYLGFVFPLLRQDFYRTWLYMSNTTGVSYEAGKAYPLRTPGFIPGCLVMSVCCSSV
jgi:hypothetical protein